MVVIIIRLVGEQDDRLFEGIGLDNQILYVDLKKRIKTVTNVPTDFQQVLFRGDRLPFVERPLQDIKFGEELVVKHSELHWWEQYKKHVNIALKPGKERLNNAKEAVLVHKRLMETGFFMVYSSFHSFRMEHHHKIASWTDGNIQLMQEATKAHFLKQHYNLGADDTDFKCRFEVRPEDLGGSRKNTLAFIQLHGQKEETKYNIKCHHFGSLNSSTRGQSPDIKEIYCYKLLELIHVGPKAQFILPHKFAGSRTSLYITTLWNDNFTPLSSNTDEAVGVDVLVQILVLGTFLFIDDLHSDNCGYWKDTKEVAIVDFMPRAFDTFTNVKRAFLNNDPSVYWNSNQIDALDACDEATRMEIARKCLKKWDLLSKIDIANEHITPEKNQMKDQDIGFKGFNSPTEQLDQYISTIKQNIVKLSEFLKVSE